MEHNWTEWRYQGMGNSERHCVNCSYRQDGAQDDDEVPPCTAPADILVATGQAGLQQVGWFCVGGHPKTSRRDPHLRVKARPSLVMHPEPQCEHAVPAYVLVNPKEKT